MQIDLAQQTIQRVQALTDAAHGVTADDVINQALDCFEKTSPANGASQRQDPQSLVERFREFRGAIQGMTIEDIVAARHEGLP